MRNCLTPLLALLLGTSMLALAQPPTEAAPAPAAPAPAAPADPAKDKKDDKDKKIERHYFAVKANGDGELDLNGIARRWIQQTSNEETT